MLTSLSKTELNTVFGPLVERNSALVPTQPSSVGQAIRSAQYPLAVISSVFLMMVLSTSVQAHAEEGVAGGFVSGFLHPVYGLDHLVAMVAVGLWGAQLGNPAIWLLPVAFPLIMALGALAGILGLPLPLIEVGIAVSALVLGVCVALKLRPGLPVALAIVSGFAIFHGHAHGTELPASANALSYAIGFVLCTGLLHLAGIAIGLLTRWPAGSHIIRALGGGIGALGLYFLSSQMMG